jgi:hypothetical protein
VVRRALTFFLFNKDNIKARTDRIFQLLYNKDLVYGFARYKR